MSEFLDKLCGTGRYRDAKETVESGKDKRLRGRKKRDFNASERILQTRRQFLKRAGAATALTTVAVGAPIAYHLLKDGPKKPSAIREVKPKDELTKRQEILDQWLKPLKKIAENSNNELLKTVTGFIERNATLAKPYGNAIRFLQRAREKEWFALLSIDNEDLRRHPFWHEKTKDAAGSQYLPDQRTLLLKCKEPLSDIWKAALFAHEGFHAFDNIKAPYNWHDMHEYVKHEVRAHSFENDVLSETGKSEYKNWLQGKAAYLRGILKTKGIDLTKNISIPVFSYDPELEKIFGKSLSVFERNLRGTHTWIHAVFTLIDADYPDKKEELKRNFLKMNYQSTGIKIGK